MVNFGPLTAEISWGVWGTQQISTGFASWLRYCSDVAHRRPTKLCTMFGSLLGWYNTYSFWGLLPPGGILPGAKFTLRPTLVFSYIVSVTARHSSSGRQPNCDVVQGMELPNFRRGRHLYSAGRPSRLASAHILVGIYIGIFLHTLADTPGTCLSAVSRRVLPAPTTTPARPIDNGGSC